MGDALSVPFIVSWFPGFGWVGRWGEKKITRNLRTGGLTSIIAMEPENNETWLPNQHKLNMAENVMVNFIKKKAHKE